MPDREVSNVPVKSVETAFDVVDALQELNGAGITELAEHTGKSKSTVHNHLRTLRRRRYVSKDGDTYRLGLRFLDHGSHARERDPSYGVVRPKVREVAEETGEICQFVVEERDEGIVLFQDHGEHAVETRTRVGTMGPLNGITGGKAILAHLPTDRVEDLGDDGLPTLTENTVTDPGALSERLEGVRERGYAVNEEEHIKGLRAISVPITTADGDLLGALGVAGPSYRLQEPSYESEIADTLLSVANELELNVTYSRF